MSATMRSGPERIAVDVGDTELSAVVWNDRGEPGPTVVALHGITANAWSWASVARELDGEVRVVAVDLRGRGASAPAPPPFGIRRHADDIAAVVESLGGGPSIVAGHSMGAYVALMCRERHPASVRDLVLVDGGIPLPVPDGVDPQDALDAALGPAMARLRRVWPDRVSYRAVWEQHPAFAGRFTPEVERYVLSDLVETDGGFRSSVSEVAVRHDGGELLVDHEVRTALDRHHEPIRILRAELGLFGSPPPLVPAEFVDRYPHHQWTTVNDSNHYDILFGDAGARAVAGEILAAARTAT